MLNNKNMLSSEDVHSAKTMCHVTSSFFQVQPGDELVELEVDKNGNRDSAPGECLNCDFRRSKRQRFVGDLPTNMGIYPANMGKLPTQMLFYDQLMIAKLV